MKLQPMRDLLLITLDEKDNKVGGFYVVDAWEDTERTGTVEAIGPEVTNFKAGERIYVNPYAVIEVPISKGNKTYRFIKQEDILAKL